MSVLWLLVGLIILSLGAEILIRGASSIASRLGLSELLIGLTIVSFGTSAPELGVSLRSALGGETAIALGNVIGSNIFNVAFILGLTALISPLRVKRSIVRRELPILLIVSVAFAGWLLWQGGIGRMIGLILVAGLVFYTWDTYRAERHEVTLKSSDSLPAKTQPMLLSTAFILAGLVMLVIGSQWFVQHAIILARAIGVSEAVIGLTIVAAGTSLPELAASVAAALRKKADLAIGNIVGSNLFNILGIAGLCAVVHPLTANGINPIDLAAMLVTSILLLPFLITRFTLSRWEGLTLIGLQCLYLWHIWPTE